MEFKSDFEKVVLEERQESEVICMNVLSTKTVIQ